MACKTDLPLRAQADIEARLEKIYRMAVLLYPTMFFPGMPGLDPLLPYTRKTATLKLEYQGYARQLFDAEAQEYPKLPDARSNMSGWLDTLRVFVENDVISHQRQRGIMWSLHCSEQELRQAIREALKDRSVPYPDQTGLAEQKELKQLQYTEPRRVAPAEESKRNTEESAGERKPATAAPQNALTMEKKPRQFREPNLELLKNPDATLNRKNAAEALGITERTLDRWTDKELTPVGAGSRKRFKTKDLLRLLNRKHRDKVDKMRQE